MKNPIFLSGLVIALLSGSSCFAAIAYSSAGSTIGETFNSLSSTATTIAPEAWTNNSTLPGWYAFNRTTPAAFTSYISSTGNTAAVNILQSLGNTADRALGGQTPNPTGGDLSYGVQLTNSTAGVLSSFNLQYTGETWRVIVGEGADGFTFDYQIFAAGTGSLTAASGWNSVASLNYTSPRIAGGSSSPVDGNSAANRAVLSDSVNGVAWNPGDELWLRWTDNNSTGTLRAAIGIDDFSFTAVPEPSSALLGLGGISLLALRRRRG